LREAGISGILTNVKNDRGHPELQLILRYLKPYAAKMYGGFTLKFFGTVMDLLIPWILAYIIDTVTPQHNTGLAVVWGGLMLLCSLFALLGNVLANRVAALVARNATERLRHDLFAKIMHLPGGDIDRFTVPSLISRMTSDTYHVYRMIGMAQRIGIRAPILLLGGILVTLLLDTALATVLIAMLPFMALVVYYISKRGVPLYARLQSSVDKLVRIVRENASGIRIIKALSKSQDERQRFAATNKEVALNERKASTVMAVNEPIMQFLLNSGLVLVVLLGASRVQNGLTDIGKIVAFLSYFTIILQAMLTITRILTMYSKALASSIRIEEVMTAGEETGGAVPVAPLAGTPHLAFDHVTFSYGHKTPAVRDVSFALAKGQSLGILGPTGAGKSTLIRLLMRFNEVDEGRIRIDGRDIAGLPLQILRGGMGVVFQNDTLFRGTIGDNVRLGREISLDEIDLALRRARAETFVAEAGGAAAQVQTRGMNYSGGQQQRMLLARALAGKPDFLLLDDASSALDFKTEAEFRGELRAGTGATTIIIAQRISSVMHCDLILVLEDGEVRGLGTHEELMRSCSLYREIAALQLGGEAIA
jgi:ATP-binding cassette, subfamily B, multidrug efflux pump